MFPNLAISTSDVEMTGLLGNLAHYKWILIFFIYSALRGSSGPIFLSWVLICFDICSSYGFGPEGFFRFLTLYSMGSRFPSHQLSNGLYVSGRPEQPKERPPTMSSIAMPYTGGDIKKSGELGKMFDIPVEGSKSRKSGPITNAPSRTGSFGGAASHSGPIMPNAAARASYSTSGPVSSAGIPGSLTGGSNRQKSNSGPLNRHGDSMKKSSGPQSVVRPKLWPSSTGSPCNRKAITGFIARYPDAELRTAKDGQYVKVSGRNGVLFLALGNKRNRAIVLYPEGQIRVHMMLYS
ncbi:hypothetical protein HHK36_026120 [Tetracentron sinense]|uniref:Uncharacterized protein n=1 Tax=Tetracentron sinense TaxID=13715 RepID=A0A834YK29_TETSI|nr:hypothetical protein HHK36_026120 [Tetracentron sinense]